MGIFFKTKAIIKLITKIATAIAGIATNVLKESVFIPDILNNSRISACIR